MLEYGQPTMGYTLRNQLFFPYQPSVSLQLVGAHSPSLIYVGRLPGLMLCRYCAINQSCCEVKNTMALNCLEESFMTIFLPHLLFVMFHERYV